jgi:hypothetical protein
VFIFFRSVVAPAARGATTVKGPPGRPKNAQQKNNGPNPAELKPG